MRFELDAPDDGVEHDRGLVALARIVLTIAGAPTNLPAAKRVAEPSRS
ncbi:MAG TPA: hypothetical protein VF765_12335 [Polyangiaceae bacterium]